MFFAFVSCWIERVALNDAIEAGRSAVEVEGWSVAEMEEAYPVNEDTYLAGKEGREYFEQAKIDKEVLVFDTYPDDGADVKTD
jgi:hypothetical protein